MRIAAVGVILLALWPSPGRSADKLIRLNKKLCGRVVDYTANHGCDRRRCSAILGCKRDLYVYLPPCYTNTKAYPLVVWFHGAFGDESATVLEGQLGDLDRQIRKGQCPPVVIAFPDGTFGGKNSFSETHSFFVNSKGGRFEDHIMDEVVPFVLTTYSIRPEREAHFTTGISAGGFGALSLAIRRRDFFGGAAIMAAPVNMRHGSTRRGYFSNFNPKTYTWRESFDPRMVVGHFAFGLIRFRAERLIGPVFGDGPTAWEHIKALNPADLIFSTNLQPCELKLYLHYPALDNFNFDAQIRSFAWLAGCRGIPVETHRAWFSFHMINYFRRATIDVNRWLSRNLPPAVVLGESR